MWTLFTGLLCLSYSSCELLSLWKTFIVLGLDVVLMLTLCLPGDFKHSTEWASCFTCIITCKWSVSSSVFLCRGYFLEIKLIYSKGKGVWFFMYSNNLSLYYCENKKVQHWSTHTIQPQQLSIYSTLTQSVLSRRSEKMTSVSHTDPKSSLFKRKRKTFISYESI